MDEWHRKHVDERAAVDIRERHPAQQLGRVQQGGRDEHLGRRQKPV